MHVSTSRPLNGTSLTNRCYHVVNLTLPVLKGKPMELCWFFVSVHLFQDTGISKLM